MSASQKGWDEVFPVWGRPPYWVYWDRNRVGMQSERLIAQVYHHLPTPTQKDFEEFASLNPKLAEQLKRQDQALKTKRMLQLGGGLVTGAFAFIGLMRMPMPILSKMSLTALAILVGIPLGGRFSDIGYWKSGVGDIPYTFPDDPQRAFLRWWRIKNNVPLPGYTTIQPSECQNLNFKHTHESHCH
jgi:hypothetical protein